MKRFYASIIFILFAGGIFSRPPVLPMMMHGPLTQILLIGKLEHPGTKSTSMPVEVFQFEDHLQVCFLFSLGDLNIESNDEAGVPVYQRMVNAASGSTLIIETGTWGAGAYTLTITDGLGGSLEGSFVIN